MSTTEATKPSPVRDDRPPRKAPYIVAGLSLLLAAAGLLVALFHGGPAGPQGARGAAGPQGNTGASATASHLGVCWQATYGTSGVTYVNGMPAAD